jgi:glycosyltransferase involved in cell wall biosynthesis/2-polyprenyl-3-methyl-5-hydroxy-6-metoxy-1,4-benzoquinol methylase
MDKFDRYLSSHFAHLGGPHRDADRLQSIRANYTELLPSDESAAVLEIGPGLGDLLYYLTVARGMRNVEAFDLSAEAAAHCSERYCPTQHVDDPIAFLRARAGQYDLIMMLHVLEHVEKSQAVPFLRAVHEALKPGGRVVIEVPNMGNPLVGLTCRYADFTHELGFTGTSLAQLLRLAGFEGLSVRPFKIPTSSLPRIAQFVLRAFLEGSMRLLTRLYSRSVEINSANLLAVACRGPAHENCGPASDRVGTHDAKPLASPDEIAVSAVMPCLNEERTVAVCIEKAFRSFSELGLRGEVVVADNGSSDRSVAIARQLGARVVHEKRKGYGSALLRGITDARGDIIVIADADDSYDWSAIAPFVRKIREGYDLVMGNRFRGGIMRGAMPKLHRYFGNPVLSFIARIAFRTSIGDFHCGMRAFTRSAFRRMQLTTTGMEFATEMVASAAHQGLRIVEIPVVLHPDRRGRPAHLRSFRDGWRHLRFILTYTPDYLYLAPGLAMLVPGLCLEALLARGPVTIRGAYLGIHFLALGSLLTLVGFNIINLGVLAKTLMAQRYSGIRSRTVNLVRRRFSLEVGLLAGAALTALGASFDLAITFRWLASHGAAMDSTVHGAFVSTTAIVFGLNLMFNSFLLNMMLAEGRRSRP